MLAQRQLTAGKFDDAMKSAMRLHDYEDILDPVTIYSLIALVCFYNQYYGQCSRAFIRLESMDAPKPVLEKYRKLAMNIFVKHPPRDPVDAKSSAVLCPNQRCNQPVPTYSTSCAECGRHFQPCVATGRSLIAGERNAVRVTSLAPYLSSQLPFVLLLLLIARVLRCVVILCRG